MPFDSSSHSTPSVKRYRPLSMFGSPLLPKLPKTTFVSAPHAPSTLSSFNNTNTTPVPYGNDRSMLNRVSNTLSRITSKPVGYGSHSPTRVISTTSSFHQPNYTSYSVSTMNLNQSYDSEPAAWTNTLRKTGNDMLGVGQTYSTGTPMSPNSYRVGASQPKVFSHHEAADLGSSSSSSGPKSPLPKAVNLQYNTPIGLYSNANIQEEYLKKVG